MGVNFITANPALEAFNKGMKAAADARMADVKLQQETLGLLEGTASAPHRIRRISADADTATANADVAKQVVPYEVQIRKNTAERGGVELDGARLGLNENRATSGSRVASQNATFDATTTTAPVQARETVATSPGRIAATNANSGVSVATAPYKVQQERDQTTIGGVKAKDSEVASMKEAITLIEAGRVEEAKEIARRRGEELPDVVINNSAMRGQMKAAIEAAERIYPDRPAAQLRHIQKIQAELAKSPDAAATAKPGSAFNVPGMEPAPELATGKTSQPTAQMQNIDDLVRRGIARDDKEAFNLITQSKQDPQASLRRLYESELKLRIDAAKGPGGMGVPPTGEALKKVQNEAIFAAGQTNQKLRNMATPAQPAPTAAAPAAPTSAPLPPAAPAAPPMPARPAPAVPSGPEVGYDAMGNPTGITSPAPGAPVAPAIPSLAPSPKDQGRMAVSSSPLAPEIQARAQAMQPDEVRRHAAAAIAAGKDRDAVLGRLSALGISTAGL